jgi:tetratricopeptide (TPR) repeat protein
LKKGLAQYALGSPLLDDSFKQDFLLLATESLIQALEARLLPASQRAAKIDQALREGYILAPYFGEALPKYEKQEQSIKLYYQSMVKAIDLLVEEKRLDNIEFASGREVRRPKPGAAPVAPKLSPAEAALEQADQLYSERSLDGAKGQFKRALELTDQKALHARAYFGLARIAALERDPELAERLFQKTIESDPDPATRSWSLVYLARLAQQHAEPERAAIVRLYQSAIAVEGGSAAARKAATEALDKLSKEPVTPRPQPQDQN